MDVQPLGICKTSDMYASVRTVRSTIPLGKKWRHALMPDVTN